MSMPQAEAIVLQQEFEKVDSCQLRAEELRRAVTRQRHA